MSADYHFGSCFWWGPRYTSVSLYPEDPLFPVTNHIIKQLVPQWHCPLNDIHTDDKYSTYSIGNMWCLAW